VRLDASLDSRRFAGKRVGTLWLTLEMEGGWAKEFKLRYTAEISAPPGR
jgi:hypothetical protein